jgi:hypothetical protein
MRLLICVGLLLATSVAHAESYTTTVGPDRRTVTTTGPRGTATTQISRSANSVTRTTTFTPNGGGSGGYQPMGPSGYRPMGR